MSANPRARRPDAAGYFLSADQGAGLLPWSAARDRLVAARNYWLSTASLRGVPHAMPVWGVWLDPRFLFSTGPTTRKARNLAASGRVVVHLESAAEVVVVEGSARAISDEEAIREFIQAYNPKYGWDFTPEQLRGGGLFEVRPRRAFAWMGDEGEAFSGTATCWDFDPAG